MHWGQIKMGWTQLIANVASPQSKALEIGFQPARKWVRFSQEWQRIAEISERLRANAFAGSLRAADARASAVVDFRSFRPEI
jgi:hypothetical protein